jgi:parallel beta-helix repeat protein
MPVDCIGNDITVNGASQIGIYVGGDNLTIERNKITATSFGIVAFGLWSPRIIGNYASGSGGIRVDSCSFGKISSNYGKAVASPGVHILGPSDNMELSSNQGDSASGNSLRVESTCTNTQKWANRAVNGPTSYLGTYGINF